MNDVILSLSLHFFICQMGLLIAPTSQDWYEELKEAMPGQLPAHYPVCSRCSLNLSCNGPFQALSTPQGLGSGRSCSTAPQLTASDWQSPQTRGPSLSQVSRVCTLEGALRELGWHLEEAGPMGRWAGLNVATKSRGEFRSPVACLVAHRDLQCDSPGGRAEGEWPGFSWRPGDGEEVRPDLG